MEAIFTAQDRRDQLLERISALIPDWSMGSLVEALRGLRGINLIAAVTFTAAVGDLGRFETPRQLMAYLGLVHPSSRAATAFAAVASRRRATVKLGGCWSSGTATRRAWRR